MSIEETRVEYRREGAIFVRVYLGGALFEVRPRDPLPFGRHFVAEKIYFGIPCAAWWTGGDYWPYWAFSVGERIFGGVPNKRETRAQALRRAWWRARWLDDGSYSDRYRPWSLAEVPNRTEERRLP